MNEKSLNKTPKVVILLGNEEQYHAFLKCQAEYVEYCKVFCALRPFAIHLCERENLSYILPEDCFPEADYYQHKKVSEDKTKELISLLNLYCSKVSFKQIGFPLEIGNYFYFLIYHVLGSLHFRTFLLSRIIDKEKPDRIISFKLKQHRLVELKKAKPGIMKFFLDESEVFYSDLLLNSKYKNISKSIEYDRKEKVYSKKLQIKQILLTALTRFPLLQNILYLWKNNINFNLIKKISSSYKKRILILGPSYNWKYVLNHHKIQSIFNMSFINGDTIEKSKKKTEWDIFNEWIEWKNEFLEFNLSSLMYDQMNMIKSTFDWMMDSYQKTVRRVKNFDLVVSSVLPFPIQNFVAHIAKSLGKPIVFYQHGEMNLFEDSLFSEASELLYLDYYLSFGEGVNSKYSKYIEKREGFKGPTAIGSASLDNLKSVGQKPGKYILYATGKYLLNSTPFISSIMPDSRLYQSQKKLLSYLEKKASTKPFQKVIFKLNNTLGASNIPFEISKVETIHYEKSFVELIPDAKLIILDAPATTCLEVCTTKKPLFVLLNRIKWFSETEELLKRRAVIAFTPEDLIKKVDDYLNTGNYPADLYDREFIKAYGTYLDDGKSVERAVDFILNL